MEKRKVKKYISKSAIATKRVAQSFAKDLKAGDILAIYGPLGAGKTTFLQGLAAGLGYKGRVTSPTFIFVRPYQIAESREQKARLPDGQAESEPKIRTLYHIDLYRIENPLDLQTIGIEEFLTDPQAISAIEWPEKYEKILPADKTIKIYLKTKAESTREIKIDSLR
jgi:tRNA threonylcarbamoyladenosine biosynthesis protein TsaE